MSLWIFLKLSEPAVSPFIILGYQFHCYVELVHILYHIIDHTDHVLKHCSVWFCCWLIFHLVIQELLYYTFQLPCFRNKISTCSNKFMIRALTNMLLSSVVSSYQSLQQLHLFLIHTAFQEESSFCAALPSLMFVTIVSSFPSLTLTRSRDWLKSRPSTSSISSIITRDPWFVCFPI